jgi:hypothetical protein
MQAARNSSEAFLTLSSAEGKCRNLDMQRTVEMLDEVLTARSVSAVILEGSR